MSKFLLIVILLNCTQSVFLFGMEKPKPSIDIIPELCAQIMSKQYYTTDSEKFSFIRVNNELDGTLCKYLNMAQELDVNVYVSKENQKEWICNTLVSGHVYHKSHRTKYYEKFIKSYKNSINQLKIGWFYSSPQKCASVRCMDFPERGWCTFFKSVKKNENYGIASLIMALCEKFAFNDAHYSTVVASDCKNNQNEKQDTVYIFVRRYMMDKFIEVFNFNIEHGEFRC